MPLPLICLSSKAMRSDIVVFRSFHLQRRPNSYYARVFAPLAPPPACRRSKVVPLPSPEDIQGHSGGCAPNTTTHVHVIFTHSMTHRRIPVKRGHRVCSACNLGSVAVVTIQSPNHIAQIKHRIAQSRWQRSCGFLSDEVVKLSVTMQTN